MASIPKTPNFPTVLRVGTVVVNISFSMKNPTVLKSQNSWCKQNVQFSGVWPPLLHMHFIPSIVSI